MTGTASQTTNATYWAARSHGACRGAGEPAFISPKVLLQLDVEGGRDLIASAPALNSAISQANRRSHVTFPIRKASHHRWHNGHWDKWRVMLGLSRAARRAADAQSARAKSEPHAHSAPLAAPGGAEARDSTSP